MVGVFGDLVERMRGAGESCYFLMEVHVKKREPPRRGTSWIPRSLTSVYREPAKRAALEHPRQKANLLGKARISESGVFVHVRLF